MAYQERVMKGFRAALDAHNREFGLVMDGETINTEVWHLVRSALIFCDAEGIDFDLIVEEARQDLTENP